MASMVAPGNPCFANSDSPARTIRCRVSCFLRSRRGVSVTMVEYDYSQYWTAVKSTVERAAAERLGKVQAHAESPDARRLVRGRRPERRPGHHVFFDLVRVAEQVEG